MQAQSTIVFLLIVSLGVSRCGNRADDQAELESSPREVMGADAFSNTSSYCAPTSNWSAWAQTSLSTWDNDVKTIVEWIINRTGLSSSTYAGHDPSIGRAADWRPHSREEGTQFANWLLANTKSSGAPLGIRYVIWQAQIFLSASGVKPRA